MTVHPDESEGRWRVYRDRDTGEWVSSPPIHHAGAVLPRWFWSWEEAVVNADTRARHVPHCEA